MFLLQVNIKEKKISEEVVLKDIKFELKRGEVLYIVGPSGAGKTLLLNHIIGMYELKKGEVKLLNQDMKITGLPRPNTIFSRIGVVFQDPGFLPHKSIFSNLELIANSRVNKKQFRDNLLKLIDFFEIQPMMNLFPKDIPLGSLKLFGIIRSLILKPELLILDEPHTGIEPFRARKVDKLIDELRSEGIGIIAAVHDPVSISMVPDKILFLLNGKQEFFGSRPNFLEFNHPITKFFIMT